MYKHNCRCVTWYFLNDYDINVLFTFFVRLFNISLSLFIVLKCYYSVYKMIFTNVAYISMTYVKEKKNVHYFLARLTQWICTLKS